ncbi:Ig-like domain repeat protein [Nocardioides pantholopis]|uniref:Ig-like domain repeat protein n=1 Tax=Nocardioides pantholopis TaxID=2483798 RepID=UPI0013DE1D0F|nr:Ig-like domain repeat protein [Nocardioides pantholopis]
MNLFSRTAAAAVTALALAIPTGTFVASAQAAPGDSVTAAANGQDSERQKPKKGKKGKKGKLSLKRSAAYSHVGQPGVKVTAVVKKKRAKGKVTFSVNGAKARKVKLKKGKASFRLPSGNAPGTYKVTAKYKGAKKATKVRVYNSAIQLSATSFTISKSADSYDLPALTGSVVFKGTPAKKGYVDIYQDGRNKAGSSSPYYCCMASVASNGTFQFSSYTFLGEVQEKKQPGTYTYQAFYTDGPAFADYIYSTPITVTVTP